MGSPLQYGCAFCNTISEPVFHALYPLRKDQLLWLVTASNIHRARTALLSITISKSSPRSHASHCIDHTYTKMAFSFGFSGDDIEEDPNDVGVQTQETHAADSNIPPPIPAKAHDLDELVRSHHLHKSKFNHR
jgi:hypothetical protein